MSIKHFFEKSILQLKNLGWICLFIVTFSVISAMIPWNDNFINRFLWGIVFLLWSTLLIYGITNVAQSNYGQLPSRFYYKSGKKDFITVFFIVIGVILFGLILSIYNNISEHSNFLDGLVKTLTEDVGAPFTIIVGIASLFGLFLTFMIVGREKREINGFAEFIKRASVLINDQNLAKQKTRFMALTPATGCLILNEDLWRSFTDLLKNNSSYIELTCLDDTTMKAWFNNYIPKGYNGQEDMKERVKLGLVEVKEIFRSLNDQHCRDNNKFPKPLRGEWNDLPHAYYLATKDTAIVVTPFFLPSHKKNPFENTNFAQVDMIGFETSDVRIVEAVNREIDLRRKSIERNGLSTKKNKNEKSNRN